MLKKSLVTLCSNNYDGYFTVIEEETKFEIPVH